MRQSGLEVTCYLRDLHKVLNLQQADFHLKWHQILSCHFLFKGQWHPAKRRSQGWRSLSHGNVSSIPAATITIPWRGGGSKPGFGWWTAPAITIPWRGGSKPSFGGRTAPGLSCFLRDRGCSRRLVFCSENSVLDYKTRLTLFVSLLRAIQPQDRVLTVGNSVQWASLNKVYLEELSQASLLSPTCWSKAPESLSV